MPLVVLACPEDADMLVVELAARHRGEIAELCEIARPSVGIVTGIGVTHLSEFGSRDAIAATKSELLASLPAGGLAIVYSGDDYLSTLESSTPARMIAVGPGGPVGYSASLIDREGHTHGLVRVGAEIVDVVIPLAGRPLMRNASMALVAAREFGVDLEVAARGMRTASTGSYRMEIVQVADRTVVNDSYNSNPTSAASALRATREMAAEHDVWAVVGGMAELGSLTADAHARLGRLAATIGYTGLVAVGDAAAGIASAAASVDRRGKGLEVISVTSSEQAAEAIAGRSRPGSFVLVKASRAVGLEGFPDELSRSANAHEVDV